MAVHVTIDELVLIGVDRGDRDAIAEAIERAIVEQLDVASLRQHVGAGPSRPGGPPEGGPHEDVRVQRAHVATGFSRPAAALGASVGTVLARVIDGRQR